MGVLLVGGAGFIGAHLARILLDRGHRVLVVDRFQFLYDLDVAPGFQHSISYRASLLRGARVLRGVVAPGHDILDTIAAFRPAAIVNLAAIPVVGVAARDPAEARAGMVAPLHGLADVLARGTVRRIVHVSTSHVGRAGRLIRENAYVAAKAESEEVVHRICGQMGVEAVVARPSGVYGPGCVTGSFLQRVMEAGHTGRPLTVTHPNACWLDPTWVGDAAQALAALVEAAAPPPAPVTIASGTPRTLADILAEARALNPMLHWTESTAGHPSREVPPCHDTRPLRALGLAWPMTSLTEGLHLYDAHMRRAVGADTPRPVAMPA